jgi:hypothetical protein
MQIQINTGHNINGSEALIAKFTDVVQTSLDRFNDRITQVEVYLSDENADKSGPNEKLCKIEVRLEGRRPVAVTHHASSLEQALHGAAKKMAHMIESTLGKLLDADRHQAPQMQPVNGE